MAASESDNKPVQFLREFKEQRGDGMAKTKFAYMPNGNPCAQCGKPIAAPEWIEESDPHRVTYLWHCWACDYLFEAEAYFDEPQSADALAA
jgi:hypothetical protein